MIASLIDRGGNLPNMAGVGSDGILGSGDDRVSIIGDDNYALEGVGRSQDIQNVRAQVIASLSVGIVTPTDEAEAVRAMIAGLAARDTTGDLELSAQYSPLDTRKILGLSEQSPDTFQPNWESAIGRFEDVKSKLESRLERLEHE